MLEFEVKLWYAFGREEEGTLLGDIEALLV